MTSASQKIVDITFILLIESIFIFTILTFQFLIEVHDNPRYRDLKGREENSTELVAAMDDAFAKRSRDELLEIFASEDLIYSPIKDYWEVVNDPQGLDNEYIIEFDHPYLGKLKEIGIPAKLSKTPRIHPGAGVPARAAHRRGAD
ncbi:CoA transferase [Thermodesulfobacteriota bacterium]